MEIKTKFNIGDTVYLMRKNVIVKTVINRIQIDSNNDNSIKYSLDDISFDEYGHRVEDAYEYSIFDSPEKLTKDLIKRHKELFK